MWRDTTTKLIELQESTVVEMLRLDESHIVRLRRVYRFIYSVRRHVTKLTNLFLWQKQRRKSKFSRLVIVF